MTKVSEDDKVVVLPLTDEEAKAGITKIKKGNITIIMPPMDAEAKAARDRFIDFLAEMIIKYGPAMMAEIEAKEKAEKGESSKQDK